MSGFDGVLVDDSDDAHYRQVEVDFERLTMHQGRTFDTGATRDTDDGKLDYEAFNAPIVEREYAAYMHDNRKQVDGVLRDGDNWQKGIPRSQYMKSLIRHVMDVWHGWRQGTAETNMIVLLCAIRFNVNGLLYEILTGRDVNDAG